MIGCNSTEFLRKEFIATLAATRPAERRRVRWYTLRANILKLLYIFGGGGDLVINGKRSNQPNLIPDRRRSVEAKSLGL